MNLIEQLGGYNIARKMSQAWESSVNGDIPSDTRMFSYNFGVFSWSDLQYALLEYRQQHNIFEVGDKVVYKHSKIIHVMTVQKVGSRGNLICDGDYFENTDIRHATLDEIERFRYGL